MAILQAQYMQQDLQLTTAQLPARRSNQKQTQLYPQYK